MGPPLKWWTAMKAAPVVCWETKRAFDHLGAHHFLMPLLEHDYRETFPLTLYVASSALEPSLCHILWWENSLRTVAWPHSSVTLPRFTFPAWSTPTTMWSTARLAVSITWNPTEMSGWFWGSLELGWDHFSSVVNICSLYMYLLRLTLYNE